MPPRPIKKAENAPDFVFLTLTESIDNFLNSKLCSIAIIPIRLEKVRIPPEWQYQIAGIQWIESGTPEWKSRLLVALGGPKVSAKDEMELLIAADDKYYAGQFVDAVKLYEEVLSLNPNNNRANEYLIKSRTDITMKKLELSFLANH